MEITFKAENGMCPRFQYKDIVFFIQDKKDYKGDWVYSLWSKELTEEMLKFETHDAACEYMRSITGVQCKYWSGKTLLYTSVSYNYIIVDNIIRKRETPTQISWDFDSYLECLDFSKKHVADYIKRQEPEQMSLFQQSK